MASMDTLVQGILHMGPAPHPDVAARGVPEPLEGVFGTADNPLGPKVVRHVSLHRLEVLDLMVVQILQGFYCGRDGQFCHNHVPGIVESFDVVPDQPESLKVVEIVEHLAVLARRVVTEHQRQEHPSADYLVAVIHVRRHLRELAAKFAVTDLHESGRNLAV